MRIAVVMRVVFTCFILLYLLFGHCSDYGEVPIMGSNCVAKPWFEKAIYLPQLALPDKW
jgi:hypothetical protein